MNDREFSHSSRNDRVRSSRPTIALCSGSLDYPIPVAFLNSVAAAADAADANFLYFCSHPVGSQYNFEIQEDIFYATEYTAWTAQTDRYNFEIQANIFYAILADAIADANVDGILIASSLLAVYQSFADIRTFFYNYHPVPMVSLGLVLDGIPSVVLDNFAGMYAAVVHLIEVHGYRKIAYLGGPEEHPEAQERYRAYTTALHDHGLTVNPELVVFGTFLPPSGANAARRWFDEHNYEIEAVVAANDQMALELMLEIQYRGFNVPNDVAIVGFDDIHVAQAMTPSLTTVRQPFESIGRKATELLLAQVGGHSVPDATRVPTQAVVRQSCGCPAVETHQDDALQGKVSGEDASQDVVESQSKTLWESPHQFFNQLNHAIFQTAYMTVSNIAIWNDMLSLLRTDHPAIPFDDQETPGAEAGAQFRTVLGKTMLLSLQDKRSGDALNRLGERIISTLSVTELTTVLTEELPRLGVHRGYIALYEDPPPYQFPQPVPKWSRLILAYNEQGAIPLPQGGERFPTHEFLPQRFWSSKDAHSMVVEAVYFQHEQIGFILFEFGADNAAMYETLRRYLSSSLHGTLLVERVQAHANELAAAYEEIRILNNQLHEENRRMGAELDVVRRLQNMILPSPEELQQISELDIVGYMQPADEVGGDYYDVLYKHDILQRHGVLHIGIGDVTGHGLESGVLMLMTQTAIRTLIEHGETDPVAFVNTLNRTIYKNARRMQTEKTLTFALIHYQNDHVKIVGQHEYALVMRRGGRVERIDTFDLGFPLGLEPEISRWVDTATISLEPGESLVLYTDGITEAENIDRQLYGLDRLCAVLSRHWEDSAEAIKQAVVDDVMRYIGTQKVYDDLTLVIMKQL